MEKLESLYYSCFAGIAVTFACKYLFRINFPVLIIFFSALIFEDYDNAIATAEITPYQAVSGQYAYYMLAVLKCLSYLAVLPKRFDTKFNCVFFINHAQQRRHNSTFRLLAKAASICSFLAKAANTR